MLNQVVSLLMLKVMIVSSHVEDPYGFDIVDLSRPTTWNDMSLYYGALEKQWSICYNCGAPSLGTALHLESPKFNGAVHPAVIPVEYLLTRLQIIDVSSLATINSKIVLTPEVALQWPALKKDPVEATLLLFRFGWTDEDNKNINVRSCSCEMPGISYELAEWIVANLTHVVGVGTDTPCVESEQTREFATRTVSHILARSGVYMIENINLRRKIPEHGCLTLAMPLKLLNSNYVPTRLTAFCPPINEDVHVVMTIRHNMVAPRMNGRRMNDVNLDEILS